MIPTDESGGLRIASPAWLAGSRRVRQHDGCPARNVPGRENVREPTEAAGFAAERGLVGPVPLVDVAASWAPAGGVPRINQRHGDAREGGLVGDERPELVERPGCAVSALSLPNRCPFADPAQILKLDPAPGVFGLTDQGLADAVVDVPAEPGLLPAPAGEQPLCGLGS